MRTIYVWHALALFTEDKIGYMKPTEGMSENGYKRCKGVIEREGGIWLWIWKEEGDHMCGERCM